MKALVYIEKKDGSPIGASLELFSAAQAVGAEVTAVTVDIPAEHINEDVVTGALVQEAKEGSYDLILLSATTLGKIVAPRVAARIQAGSVNDAIALEMAGDELHVIRPVFGGTAQEEIGFASGTAVVSVRGGSYQAPESIPEAKEITSPDADSIQTKVLELIAEAGEEANLEDAKIIVSGGRGMGEEGFPLCGELAGILGGVVGATRPAIESGWINRTHQVGQSGKIVAPDLYFACGVSGATQHVSGMSGSKYIIAINKDEEAPIFEVADIGIVGDAKKILPLMIEEFKKKQA